MNTALGVITFRYLAPGRSNSEIDGLQADIAKKCVAEGFAALSTTMLRGRTVLRLCTINPRATDDDMTETIRRLGDYGARFSPIASER